MEDDAKEQAHTPSAVKVADSLNMPRDESHKERRRLATVYDAVAGKVSYQQPLRDEQTEKGKQPEPRVIQHSTRETPFAPDEVLFRRKDAPERYAEHDIYHANERDLPRGGRAALPESDLLKAVHAYSSKFYGALERERRHLDERNADGRSMDETALLAFGILLEEAGKETLGRRGDLVFTEGAEASETSGDEVARPPRAGHVEIGSWTTEPKRRKLNNTEYPDP